MTFSNIFQSIRRKNPYMIASNQQKILIFRDLFGTMKVQPIICGMLAAFPRIISECSPNMYN
jgi:hypothetical protein